CQEARQKQTIASDWLLEKVSEEIKQFRTSMAILCNFDWVPLPIAYPQLIVLTVHVYFLICVISRQHILSDEAPNKSRIDMIVPIMSTLQFIFYMGWLKVAEVILNPFGEDDDDFECNFLLDKNLTIGLTVVDEGYDRTPEILKDSFWKHPIEPLYSRKAVHAERRMSGITGSIAHIVLPESEHDLQMMPLPSSIPRRSSILSGLLSLRGSIGSESNSLSSVNSRSSVFSSRQRVSKLSAGDLAELDSGHEVRTSEKLKPSRR
uniref:Bestrophin homolog n=2 Tax=Parascaris TaxID=6254 RepID=A0A915AI41_PARUN